MSNNFSFNSCHSNRAIEDQIVLGKICFDILSQDIVKKHHSDEFCGVFVDGRNRDMRSYEDYAAFKSIKLFSEKDYPILAFVNKDVINSGKFLDSKTISDFRIFCFPIESLNSLDEYTSFCIKRLYNLIPADFSRGLFFQPDGFLINNGWERFVKGLGYDFLGAKWIHSPAVETFVGGKWINTLSFRTRACNGGFSYRYIPRFRAISEQYGHLKLREVGTEDKHPPEDLFFGYHIFGESFPRLPDLASLDTFCLDPIDLNEYNQKASFGFHCPKKINEWKLRKF